MLANKDLIESGYVSHRYQLYLTAGRSLDFRGEAQKLKFCNSTNDNPTKLMFTSEMWGHVIVYLQH